MLPFLAQYGSRFKTHRVFRHYVHAAILPAFFFYSCTYLKHFSTIEQLWAVHARRMQAGYFPSLLQNSG